MKARIYEALSSKYPKPKNGSLRVWWIPQVPGEPFLWPVKDFAEASKLLDVLAAYDDFQHANRIKPDYSFRKEILE